jgi:26S proteasome regulatory subunit N1
MTMAKPETRTCLKYKLEGNVTDVSDWGHEYVRTLSGEVGQEFDARTTDEKGPKATDDLVVLVNEIVPYHLSHNAEHDAVDLLIEVGMLDILLQQEKLDQSNFQRVTLYLVRTSNYISEADELEQMMNVTYELYLRHEQHVDALRMALRMESTERIVKAFSECKTPLARKQMAFVLGAHRRFDILFQDEEEEDDEEEDEDNVGLTFIKVPEEEVDDLNNNGANQGMQESFATLARELDVEEPKTPEDIYKSRLSETGGFKRGKEDKGAKVESARQNLASTFVNAFVNCAYGTDKLMTPENSGWVHKNKEHGKISATASLGMLMLWNVDEGLVTIDKYLYMNDDNVKAGALLAAGITNAGVRDECDSAHGLLPEHMREKTDDGKANSVTVRSAAVLALGIAYSGNPKGNVLDTLTSVVEEDKSIQVASLGAVAIGLVFAGTCNEEACQIIVQRLMEAEDKDLDEPIARFLVLGLGLLFLGRGEKADAIMEMVKTIEHKIAKFAEITLRSCAYANTGNVLEVQKMLHECAEHLDEAPYQAVAVLGISMICNLESVGQEMALRTMDHLLQYGEVPVRRGVPIAIGMLHVSDPDYAVIDILSKLTHDQDAEVAMSAIFSLGLVGAGTNNSRVAGLLRQLSSFYNKEANHLFVVRIAQGLLHMGKGLVTLAPSHSDKLLTSTPALASLVIAAFSCLDIKNTLCGQFHYLLYVLACAMKPRMLMTLDEEGNALNTNVRVGEAVETVGQAGRPKTISGFQTHTTPVLLGVGDRAELASDDFIPQSKVLEGFVILTKNPDAKKPEDMKKALKEKRRARRKANAEAEEQAKKA